jgi:TatD DNase family protein
VPIDRVLTETDSPFLAPVPYRGKRNEPSRVSLVVSAMAELYRVDADEMGEQTARNFHSLFEP